MRPSKRPKRSRKAGPEKTLGRQLDIGDALARAKRREPKGKSRPLLWLTVAVIVAAMLGVLGFAALYPMSAGPGPGKLVEVTLLRDMQGADLAEEVCKSGLAQSCAMFKWYARLANPRAGAGVHVLYDDMSPGEIVLRFDRRGAHQKVTFPEGYTRFDMAKRLEEKRILSSSLFLKSTEDAAILRDLAISGKSAEGYLFPATYEFAGNAAPADIVRKMKREFDRRWATLNERYGAELLGLRSELNFGQSEIVTLASMVEKEARIDDERATVASVFLNRLTEPTFAPKLLQCDPTAAYGCLAMRAAIPTCAEFNGKVTAAMMHDSANPYSTYTHEGLPPGPIASPGYKSLEAAIASPKSKYLYFVAKGDGRHTFSETYDAHNAAVLGGKKGR